MSTESSRAFSEEFESSFGNCVRSPDAFAAVDYNFCFLFVNALAEKFYCRKRHQLIGFTMETLFPEVWGSQRFKLVRSSIDARKTIEMKYDAPSINHWVQLTGRPFENYYTLSYRRIDHKEALRAELRQQVKRN